jgi:hypothetical protein
MSSIGIHDDGIEVDAAMVARGLKLDASLVPALMKAGQITSGFERGEDVDAGRYRLTFFHRDRSFRMIVDAAGAIFVIEEKQVATAATGRARR